jgi:hypothetical protein
MNGSELRPRWLPPARPALTGIPEQQLSASTWGIPYGVWLPDALVLAELAQLPYPCKAKYELRGMVLTDQETGEVVVDTRPEFAGRR